MKAILLLQDGRFFEGSSLGFKGECVGEVCFNTGMTGYQEILTDPSYCRQIVTMTTPHIGNYGINSDDEESNNIQAAGLVIKEDTIIPSNWRSQNSLSKYLESQGIVGIKNVDTRALTKHIRDNGAMNGLITTHIKNMDSLSEKLKSIPNMSGLDLAKEVTCKTSYEFEGGTTKGLRVAAIDFGIKQNILRLLAEVGCSIKVFPANVSADEIIKSNPDGVFLSNGPGDPSAVSYGIKTVSSLLGKKPIFGICLGHQILAISLGAKTYKLKFGHRGINHPVKHLEQGTIEITSQNHGFAVDMESLPENVTATHLNLNDNTLAGLKCDEMNAFSVQYHPESSPGPHDSRYLFNNFIKMMKDAKKN